MLDIRSFCGRLEEKTEDLETEDRRKEASAVGLFSQAGTFVPKGPLYEMSMMAAVLLCLEHFIKCHSHGDGVVAAVFNRHAFFACIWHGG